MAGKWSTGLFACTEDIPACCFSFWCLPCFACKTYKTFGENMFTPVFDACGAVPVSAVAMRLSMRNRYNIPGSILDDIVHSFCCCPCVYCQMSRELEKRGQS